jgi:hypothetical protein
VDPVPIFKSCVPRRFLEDTVKNLFNAFEVANEECGQKFDAEERHDVLPIYRRGKVEQGLRQVALRHKRHVRAVAETNSRGTSFHTEVTAGAVILTAHQVDGPNELVRRAVFRETLARQQNLFEDWDTVPDSPLYAVLLYGPNPRMVGIPGFAHIQFPAAEFRAYMGRGIDLFVTFPKIVSLYMPQLRPQSGDQSQTDE